MNHSFAQPPIRFSTTGWKVPAAFLALLALFLVIALTRGLAPMLWVAAPIVIGGFIAAAWRMPQFFLVATVFVPQWKSLWPFYLFDSSGYLTMVMLAGLVLGVFFILFRIMLGTDAWTFGGIFYRQKHVLLLFGLFSTVVSLSYLYTTAPSYGGTKIGRLIFIGGLFLVSPLLLLRTEKAFTRFAQLFVGFSIVTSMEMIVSLRNRAANAETDITRIGAGWLMGMALLLILFYPVFESTKWPKTFFYLVLPILAAGLIASAARGAIVSFAITLPVALFVGPRQHRKMTLFAIGAIAVCSIVAFMFLRGADPGKYSAKISEMIAMSEGKSTSGSATKRLDFYRETLEAIPDHLLLGNGVGSWGVFYYGNDARGYPHNLVLEIAFEEGLLGLTVLGVFFLAVGTTTYRTYQITGSHFAAVTIVLAYGLVVSMFSGDLDDNRLLWLWAGVALAVCRNVYLAGTNPVQYLRMAYPSPFPIPKYTTPKSLNARPGLSNSL